MDNLPPEILSEIVQCIVDSNLTERRTHGTRSAPLSAYVTISRAWQSAIERLTFRSLKIRSCDFEAFESIFRSGNAGSICTELNVNFDSEPADGDTSQSVTDTFSQEVATLFNILASTAQNTLSLKFFADANPGPVFGLSMPHSTPTLPQVTAFEFAPWLRMAQAKYSVVLSTLAKLPNVQQARIGFWEHLKDGARERRLKRQGEKSLPRLNAPYLRYAELSNTICSMEISNVKELHLSISKFTLNDEDRTPDYLISRDESTGVQDPYSCIFHHLTTLPSLTVLRLTGPLVISPSIFSKIPPFPALVDFQLDFSTETADGRWFFVRDEEFWGDISESSDDESDESSEDESDIDREDSDAEPEDEEGPWDPTSCAYNLYRTWPNPELIPSLLLDAARFVETFRHLRTFILRHRNGRNERDQVRWPYEGMDRHLEVLLVKGGRPRGDYWKEDRIGRLKIHADNSFIGYNRLYWRTCSWRPDEHVLEAWKKAAGANAIMFYLKEEQFSFKLNHNWPEYLGDLTGELVEEGT